MSKEFPIRFPGQKFGSLILPDEITENDFTLLLTQIESYLNIYRDVAVVSSASATPAHEREDK